MVATLAKRPEIEKANDMHDSHENSRLYTCTGLSGDLASVVRRTHLFVAQFGELTIFSAQFASLDNRFLVLDCAFQGMLMDRRLSPVFHGPQAFCLDER